MQHRTEMYGACAQNIAKQISAGLISALFLAPTSALSQQTTLNLTTRLQSEDGDALIESVTQFDQVWETRTQSLSFGFDATLEHAFGRFDEGLEFTEPALRLGYSRELRNHQFSIQVDHFETDVVDIGNPAPSLTEDPDELFIGGGTREQSVVDLTWVLGNEEPVGATFSFSQSRLRFSETSDQTLIGNDTTRANAELRFDLSPRVTLRNRASFLDIDRLDGGVQTETTAVSSGLSFILSDVANADFDLGLTRVRQNGDEDEELSASVRLVLARPNGTISGQLNSNLTTSGQRSTLQLNRSLELRNGSLAMGVGLSHSDVSGTDPFYDLSFNQTWLASTFNVSVQQAFDTNSTGNETLNSRVRMSYDTELTPRSSFSSSLSASNTDVLSQSNQDQQRIDLNLSIRWNLREDWDLEGGYAATRLRQNGETDTNERLFIGLRNTFRWGG